MIGSGKVHREVAVAGQGLSAVVFYDGHCRLCCQAAAWITRLDWFRCVAVSSFRHDDSWLDHGLSLKALESDMHVVVRGEEFKGFDAVSELAKRLPLLWPVLPAFLMVGQAGLGNRLYRFLADNRVIAGDSRSCSSTSVCSKPGY
jgi:predicted DCC family thiol-disulfide oxidoreductase YuxK